MPVELPESPWQFHIPPRADDFVAVGADLQPATLLSAYKAGLFPMPERREVGWWSPVLRGVMPIGGMHISRSLQRVRGRFEVRVDTAFESVVRACADPRRPYGWITEDFVEAYLRLHLLGWAHSVEVWREGRLAGGVYGVAVGGLFAGESMFSHQRDASKVALAALVDLLDDEYADRRLFDVQWQTEHLASLGVIQIPREDYLSRLKVALEVPLPQVWR